MKDFTKGIVYGGVIASAIVGELNSCAALTACKRSGLIGNGGYLLGNYVIAVGAWAAGVGGLYISNKVIEYIEKKDLNLKDVV